MTGPWEPWDYRDSYTNRVNDLIEAKKNDEGFQPAGEAPPGTTVVDLTEALRASVNAAKTKKTPGGKRGGRGKAKKKADQAEPARRTRSRKPHGEGGAVREGGQMVGPEASRVAAVTAIHWPAAVAR